MSVFTDTEQRERARFDRKLYQSVPRNHAGVVQNRRTALQRLDEHFKHDSEPKGGKIPAGTVLSDVPND